MSTRPRIAITPSSRLDDYVRAIAAAGGDPVVLDVHGATAPALLAGIEALVLTGGGDVDPVLFGEARHTTFHPSEPGRDAAEIALVLEALATDLPLLAICRGLQVLNVALGGSLVQDIPTEVVGALDHRVATSPTTFAHDVQVTAGSTLARLLGSGPSAPAVEVNSRHHQSAKRVGAGLVVTAVAPDGVIEALEAPDRAFCVGVQWHPENFVATGEFRQIFDALTAAIRP